MYHDYFSNFARRNCAFFSDAVPVHRVVRAVEFKMATGCKFLSLAASQSRSQGLRGETVTKTLVKFVSSFQNFGKKIACAVRHNRIAIIQLCRTAHAIFFPKFWNDEMNFTRVFVTVSPRRPWDRGWPLVSSSSSAMLFYFWRDIYFHAFVIQSLFFPPKMSLCNIKNLVLYI